MSPLADFRVGPTESRAPCVALSTNCKRHGLTGSSSGLLATPGGGNSLGLVRPKAAELHCVRPLDEVAALPRSLNAHAFEKALPSHVRERFPVLLFSHGLGENTARYSSVLEELASYGYVVAAIDHTYDNQGTVFPDGRILRQSGRWGRAFSGSQAEQERFIIERLNVLVADVSFVLNRLEDLNGEEAGMFHGKLDMSQVGFFGHSLGGAIAPLACQKDARFKACLNMDGMPTSQALISDPALGLERPFMFLTENPSPTELELERRALTRSEYEERDRARRRRMFHLLDTSGADQGC